MKREDLRALGLSDEQIDAVMQQNGTDIENARREGNAHQTRAQELQDQLTSMAASLATAQASAGSAAQLRQQLAEMTNQFNALNKSNAIREALREYKPRDAAMLVRLLDLDRITLGDDGKVQGLKEQVEPLKQASGYLFSDTADEKGGSGESGSAGGAFDMNAFLRS